MTARIYVGTYAKYNSGSIKGAWIDLEDHADKESFLEACKELHKDEPDPELMFQDYEGFPKSYYHESSVPEELWDWLAAPEDDRNLLEIYREHVDGDATLETARDNFAGTFDSEEDWAAQFLEDTGALEAIPENLRNYFNYEAYARDARIGGDITFVRHDGDVWAFWNH